MLYNKNMYTLLYLYPDTFENKLLALLAKIKNGRNFFSPLRPLMKYIVQIHIECCIYYFIFSKYRPLGKFLDLLVYCKSGNKTKESTIAAQQPLYDIAPLSWHRARPADSIFQNGRNAPNVNCQNVDESVKPRARLTCCHSHNATTQSGARECE